MLLFPLQPGPRKKLLVTAQLPAAEAPLFANVFRIRTYEKGWGRGHTVN